MVKDHWFERTVPPRPWSTNESEVVAQLSELLWRTRPSQVSASRTFCVAEGKSQLFAIVPHRSLGKICLVISITALVVQVSWHVIHSFCECHCDLDAGFWAGTFQMSEGKGDRMGLWLKCVDRELGREIGLKIYKNKQNSMIESVLVQVAGSGRKWHRVGRIGRMVALPWRWEASFRATSMLDSAAIPHDLQHFCCGSMPCPTDKPL